MQTVWKKSVAKKTFKDLKVDTLFVEEDDYTNDPSECLVYIKTSNAKINNAYYIDGCVYKTTTSPNTVVVPVYVTEMHLETEEEE